jgi:hypothetical protein
MMELVSLAGLTLSIFVLMLVISSLDKRISKLEAALNPNNGGDE